MRSPEATLVRLVLIVAGAGMALSLVPFGAKLITLSIGIALVVAAIGVVSAPWLAPRSGRAGAVCGAVALALEVVAALLLSTSPLSNSPLWVPINLGRFGGVIVAELGLALTLHAVALRRMDLPRALALVSADVIAVVIGAVITGPEIRD